MKIGVLGCSGDDYRQLKQVAEECSSVVLALASDSRARRADVDVVFIGWSAAGSACEPMQEIRDWHVPTVVLLSQYSSDLRQKAFAAGARDVLCSPADPGELRAELRSLADEEPPAEAVRRAEFESVAQKLLVGSSLPFKRCVEQLRKATLVDVNVLLLGETGTGNVSGHQKT